MTVPATGAQHPLDPDAVLAALDPEQREVAAHPNGPMVVLAGAGTGKTAVALHRAAYLLYSDPRLNDRRGGVLVVGPSQPYLAYVSDVLPSLGEEGVQTCTLRDLVPQGATAGVETDPEVAALKARAELVAAIEPAVRFHEEPPHTSLEVETPFARRLVPVRDEVPAERGRVERRGVGGEEVIVAADDRSDDLGDQLGTVAIMRHTGKGRRVALAGALP